MAWYLKWPTDTGSGAGNNKLCQLSGIATTGNVNISLEFAENLPATGSHSSYGYALYDGRRALDSTTQGAGGYVLKFAGTVEQSGGSNFRLNGAVSNLNAWQTAVSGDVYSFDSGVQVDGVISVGARFNQAEMLPGLTLKKIVITDSNGAHTIDMSSSGGTLNQFTSTDGVVTLKLFGFAGSSHWIEYSPPVAVKKNLWRNFPTGSIKPSAFIPWNNAESIISEFWQAPPITDFTANVSGSLPKLTASITLQSVSAGNTLAINSQLPKLTGSITGLSATTITTFIAASLPKLTGSVALNSAVPVFTAAISGQLPKLTGSLSLTSTAPAFTAAVNGQLPKLTASVALNNAGLTLTANINAMLPKLTGSIAILSEMPLSQIDVAATLPLLTASIELFSPIIYPPADANDFTVSLTLADAETQQARIDGDLTVSADIDSLSAFNARISPTVGFSAIISSTFKFNGSLH